jgi:hypothetical protein
VSLFYFADIFLRASEKFFWYDELFTVYFARLPSTQALWHALGIGIDFNPPFFYWLTRAGNSLFGEGPVVTRLPEILGFWLLSLCLFRFVQRRAGVLAGLVAMLFPMLTQAYYYAYEARPHGVVLGFCGLAIVCWQSAMDQTKRRSLWLTGFGTALFGAFMMHCFALTLLAPFVLVELYRTWPRRRFDWPVWFSMAIPTFLAGLLYIALLHSFHKLSTKTNFGEIAKPGWQQVLYCFQFLLEPCLVIIFGALLVFAAERFIGRNTPEEPIRRTPAFLEMLLGLSFLGVPVTGVFLAKLAHAPFFHRYFISTAAGISIVTGLASGWRVRRAWLPWAMALLMSAGVLVNTGRLLSRRLHREGEWLIEPSSKQRLNTTPGKPLDLHPLLNMGTTEDPIAILNFADFASLILYASPSLKNRLYYVTASSDDFAYFGFEGLLACCDASFHRPETYAVFVREHAHFLAYGVENNLLQVGLLGQSGAHIDGIQVAADHFLAQMRK